MDECIDVFEAFVTVPGETITHDNQYSDKIVSSFVTIHEDKNTQILSEYWLHRVSLESDDPWRKEDTILSEYWLSGAIVFPWTSN